VKGSEFAEAFARKGLRAWESAAVDLALSGRFVRWPLVPLHLEGAGGWAEVHVASDYFAVGDAEDYLRLPLTPETAQKIADAFGMLLPTPKLVFETWKAAGVKAEPLRMAPNKGADLLQYREHEDGIEAGIGRGVPFEKLTSGVKKDVVISELWKPGKVLIYGWFDPKGNPIQPHSNIHGDFYVDYSHGIRFVQRACVVNGEPWDLEALYQHPTLSALVSRVPLQHTRYPVKGEDVLVHRAYVPTKPTLAEDGARILVDMAERQRKS